MNEFGFSQMARNGTQARFPWLWRDLVAAWCPGAGITGPTIVDYAGRNNSNPSVIGAVVPAWAPGRRGWALSFNGSTQFCKMLNSVSQAASFTHFSAMAWVKTATTGRDFAAQYGGQSADRSFEMVVGSTGFQFYVYGATTANRLGSVSISDGKWHHVCGVYDGPAATLNVFTDGLLTNGTLTGTVPASMTALGTSNNPVTLGCYNSTNAPGFTATGFFNGLLGEVMLWKRSFTAPEVMACYAGAHPLVAG